MTRSRRLRPVSRVAGLREHDAARRLADCQAAVRAGEARLADLRRYRDDYQREFVQRGAGALGASRMNEYREFLARLDEAITHLDADLERRTAVLARCKADWIDARHRAQALDRVVTRLRRSEERERREREQIELDELARRPR